MSSISNLYCPLPIYNRPTYIPPPTSIYLSCEDKTESSNLPPDHSISVYCPLPIYNLGTYLSCENKIESSNLPPDQMSAQLDLENQPINPFDLKWLEDNYRLNRVAVKLVVSYYNCLEIEFHPDGKLFCNLFIASLAAAGCESHYDKNRNVVQLNKNQRIKLISGAEKGKNFIFSLKDIPVLDFEILLPLIDHFHYALLIALDPIKDEAIDQFLNRIESQLAKIKPILSKESIQEKLEFCYLTEKKLISYFNHFINSPKENSKQNLIELACSFRR